MKARRLVDDRLQRRAAIVHRRLRSAPAAQDASVSAHHRYDACVQTRYLILAALITGLVILAAAAIRLLTLL